MTAFAKALGFVRSRRTLNSLWVNVMAPGGVHGAHIHPHSALSGTYYVALPKGRNAIRFEDPRLPLMMAADGHTPLYLSPYIEAHKDAYYASLKAAQQRLEWHEAVGYLADAFIGTVDELMATRAALSALAAMKARLGERPSLRELCRARDTAHDMTCCPLASRRRIAAASSSWRLTLIMASVHAPSMAVAVMSDASTIVMAR